MFDTDDKCCLSAKNVPYTLLSYNNWWNTVQPLVDRLVQTTSGCFHAFTQNDNNNCYLNLSLLSQFCHIFDSMTRSCNMLCSFSLRDFCSIFWSLQPFPAWNIWSNMSPQLLKAPCLLNTHTHNRFTVLLDSVRTTRVSQHQKTRKVEPIWIYWSKR